MKYIQTYEDWNGANLSINYNTTCDFTTFQGKQFDGGDGNSGTEIPRKFKQSNNDQPIIQKGNNAEKKQKDRKERDKKLSKEYRIAKLMDYQTDDDLIQSAPRMQPTVNAT